MAILITACSKVDSEKVYRTYSNNTDIAEYDLVIQKLDTNNYINSYYIDSFYFHYIILSDTLIQINNYNDGFGDFVISYDSETKYIIDDSEYNVKIYLMENPGILLRSFWTREFGFIHFYEKKDSYSEISFQDKKKQNIVNELNKILMKDSLFYLYSNVQPPF